jgi:hypothetical protein
MPVIETLLRTPQLTVQDYRCTAGPVLRREDGGAFAVPDRLFPCPADRLLLAVGSGDQEIDDPARSK